MEDYGFFQSWAAVFCAIVGTIIWRIAGVVLASRIPADGPVMGVGQHNGLCHGFGRSIVDIGLSNWRIGNNRP